MTVNMLYTVWCNGKKDLRDPWTGEVVSTGQDCGEWITGDTAWEARDQARAQGWTCGKQMRSTDLCPACTPPKKKT